MHTHLAPSACTSLPHLSATQAYRSARLVPTAFPGLDAMRIEGGLGGVPASATPPSLPHLAPLCRPTSHPDTISAYAPRPFFESSSPPPSFGVQLETRFARSRPYRPLERLRSQGHRLPGSLPAREFSPNVFELCARLRAPSGGPHAVSTFHPSWAASALRRIDAARSHKTNRTLSPAAEAASRTQPPLFRGRAFGSGAEFFPLAPRGVPIRGCKAELREKSS